MLKVKTKRPIFATGDRVIYQGRKGTVKSISFVAGIPFVAIREDESGFTRGTNNIKAIKKIPKKRKTKKAPKIKSYLSREDLSDFADTIGGLRTHGRF